MKGVSKMEMQLWKELLSPYKLAVNEIVVKFKYLMSEYKLAGRYCPIEQVEGRVKKVSSILEKIHKKNIDIEELEEKIEDIAGIRIICKFVEDISLVVDIISSRGDMEVKEVKDYIKNSKPSGYRSYHMIVKYKVETINGTKVIPVEIQIRTLAMDFWAVIEHSLQYKYKHNMPSDIRNRLSKAADAVIVMDTEMSSIRNEIMDAQNSFDVKAKLVTEILNLMQSLCKVANRREIVNIQNEFYRIYMTGDMAALKRFYRELDIIAEGYRSQYD